MARVVDIIVIKFFIKIIVLKNVFEKDKYHYLCFNEILTTLMALIVYYHCSVAVIPID